MAHIIITKIEASDWSEIIQGHFRAFQQEPFQQLIHGEDTPRNQQIFKERSLKQFATQSNSIWLKAIDTNNGRKIVGVVNYKLKPAYVPLARPELKMEDMIWLEDVEDKRILDVMFRDIVDRKLRLLREGHIGGFLLFSSFLVFSFSFYSPFAYLNVCIYIYSFHPSSTGSWPVSLGKPTCLAQVYPSWLSYSEHLPNV